ncbi:hypothetical protein Tco_1307033, partial [Tanacetum coccineum]
MSPWCDEDPTDEDGDFGIGDSIGVSVSLGDEIFSEGIVIILEIELNASLMAHDTNTLTGKVTVVTLVEEQMSSWK